MSKPFDRSPERKLQVVLSVWRGELPAKETARRAGVAEQTVTDTGPAMKSVAVARWFAARSHLTHVRTRHRSPHTNGIVERWIETPNTSASTDTTSPAASNSPTVSPTSSTNATPCAPPDPRPPTTPRRLPRRPNTQTEPAQK